MVFSSAQNDSVQAIATASATLSLLGSASVIGSYVRLEPKRRSLNDQLVVALSCLDLCASTGFFIGRMDVANHGLCQFQGGLIQLFALATVFWNGCIAANLYFWVCGRESLQRLRARLRSYTLLALGAPSLILLLFLATSRSGEFQDTLLWCWVKEYGWEIGGFYVWVVAMWGWNIFVFASVRRELLRRSAEAGAAAGGAADAASKLVVRKMLQYVGIFIFLWSWGLLNRVHTHLNGGASSFALVALHATFVPLQGLMNALVYGGGLDRLLLWLRARRVGREPGAGRLLDDDGMAAAAETGASTCSSSSSSSSSSSKHGPPAAAAAAPPQRTAIVFSSTFNMGECGVPPAGQLRAWLEPGADLYVIGLQVLLTYLLSYLLTC